jgi:hypothetical protein
MTDPLDSARSCIQHAQRRIRELAADIQAYEASMPYEEFWETDPVSGDRIHKVSVRKLPSRELGHIAFDAMSNLRAALDQAGYAAAYFANPGSPRKNGNFPFGDSLSDVQSRRTSGNRKSRDIPDSIFEVMVDYKPYKAGNYQLWALNKLCNSNKHQTMVFPFIKPMSVTIFSGVINGTTFGLMKGANPYEFILQRIRPGGYSTAEIKFDFQIKLGNDQTFPQLPPALEYLNNQTIQVCSILDAIEVKAKMEKIFR